ncbi:MAG: sporulation protein YunB [Acutalibacteraceae bacterium]|nr:sporulation protein YunB [Acutalibacteraceae bacterium]
MYKNKISFRVPLLIVCSLLLVFFIFDYEMRPLMFKTAKKAAVNQFNTLFNNCANTYLELNPDLNLYTIYRDSNDNIINVELNQVELNKFKSSLYQNIVSEYGKQGYINVTVPVNNALNIDYISPRWLEISMYFRAPTEIDMKIDTVFKEAGINQTLQIVKLNVKADIYIIMSGAEVETACDFEYIICENVIVGKVPDTYLETKSNLLN